MRECVESEKISKPVRDNSKKIEMKISQLFQNQKIALQKQTEKLKNQNHQQSAVNA